ncbi:helix-turn-helix domain-containing protein [Tenacibaculum sp. A30]|uniref:helix-turn-helix domain-containing protein n=1 Tax=Tenacibaculum sp. A30 TaxID=3442644 RepID=UPI003EB845C5
MNPLLNSKQVMQLLNIKSPTTLIKYEKEGVIKVTRRLGNRKRYSKKDIERFLGN